jgi:exodeoxyribonuclease VII small subunit
LSHRDDGTGPTRCSRRSLRDKDHKDVLVIFVPGDLCDEIVTSMDPTIKDFESAIAELESIVKTLEDGDLALEKSLELFERGVQLSRFCHSKLEEAERRVDILNERGEIKAAPAALAGDADDRAR